MNGENDTSTAFGQSEIFLDFQDDLSRAAKVDRPVLLVGERGTGKELAAARLHYLSSRWEAPFVALNCAALAPTLIESELFGHEAGAFTGATGRRAGRFESAHTGTLFLDEVGLIPLEVQEKVLRAVEYGVFERVGGSKPTQVDVRIIGATNADLPTLAREGRFKEDLLDRLSFEVLRVPPLRERNGDVALLSAHFAARMAHELGWEDVPEFSERAMASLETYPWPGNIRELKNVVERAVYRSSGSLIGRIVFNPFGHTAPARPVSTEPQSQPVPRDFKSAVQAYELQLLRDALEAAQWNQRRAAEALHLTYHQFRGLYRKYAAELTEPN